MYPVLELHPFLDKENSSFINHILKKHKHQEFNQKNKIYLD